MRKWFASKEGKKITGIIFILCTVLIVQMIVFFNFNQKLYDMSLENSMNQVEELSVFVEQNFELEVERYIHILQVIESKLEDAETMGVHGVIDTLSKTYDVSQFKMLGVSDLDGNGMDATGNPYDISYVGMREQIQHNEVYISDVLKDHQETSILIAIPLKINHEIRGIVWGRYMLVDLLENMEFTNNSHKYFQIIDDKGNYILSSNDNLALRLKHQTEDETIWDELEEYRYTDGMSAQKIHEMVQQRESGFFYFEGDGQGRYVNFRPLKINNWYLFSVQVADELHTYVNRTRQTAVHLFTIFAIGMFTVFGAIYHLTYTMYKRNIKQTRHLLFMQGEQYRNIYTNIENNRRLRHDLRHHIVTLQGFLQRNQVQEASKYLKQYLHFVQKFEMVELCRNPVVNMVVGYYQGIALQKGIRFDTRLQIPETLSVSDIDLSVILGNLLENAIYAASLGEQEERFIRFHMLCSGKMLAITVDNSFHGELKKADGRYISTKPNHSGLGLHNIEMIADKYQGGVEFTHDLYEFHSSVMLAL